MLGRLEDCRNGLIAVGGLAAAEIDHAVGHEGVAVKGVGTGIGGWLAIR
jgi:hypothetical protein